jgi:cytosine/uracil/thiamine/allantoin permease
MLAYEFLAASIALVLSIAQVCLDMRANIFSTTEDFAALWVETCPFAAVLILLADVALDFFRRDTGVLKAGIHFEF